MDSFDYRLGNLHKISFRLAKVSLSLTISVSFTMRKIEKAYCDPLDLIWLNAAKRLGITVLRDSEVFAAWDGRGTLKIGTAETLDPDDCLAQMIFHELCHALIEGPENFSIPDWGLDIDEPSHVSHEHAALRLQSALADRFQLRNFFASTTDFRGYFDQIGPQPLLDHPEDPAVGLALSAWSRATTGEWGDAIETALQQTLDIIQVIQAIVPAESLLKTDN